MRLIDADALSYNLDGMMAVSPTGYIHGDTIADMIGDAPTIEPERKKGEWIDGYKRQTCSVCRQRGYRSWNFCPNCGADMREEGEHE